MINKYSGIKLCHINVRSLLTNIIDFRSQLMENNFEIVGIGETWLTSEVSDQNIEINGYNIVRKDRLHRRGGGVMMYVSNSIKNYELKNVDTKSFESIFITFMKNKMKIVFGVVYRPPGFGDFYEYLSEFQQTVLSLFLTCDNLVIMGDFNININSMSNYYVQLFTELLSTCNLTQLITEPTRIGQNGSTLLDLILCSEPKLADNVEVIEGIINSDHCWIQCDYLGQITDTDTKKELYFKRRNLAKINLNNFIEDLIRIDFMNVYRTHDIDEKIRLFNGTILDLFDRHAPLHVIKVTKKRSPWLSEGIRSEMKARDKARQKFNKSKREEDWTTYVRLRNHVCKLIRNAKKQYLNVNITKNNSKKSWKALKEMGIACKVRKEIPEELKDVNALNNYFTEIFNSSTAPDESIVNKYLSQKKDGVANFNFQMTDDFEIAEILSEIKSKAIGYDGIGIDMLISCCPFILPVITHIVNVCIEKGAFPVIWKTSLVIPLPKVDNPKNFKHLRPISILPCLSKVIEKILEKQIRQHLQDSHILPVVQSGYRKNHSCTTALLHIVDDIVRGTDSGKLTALILLDYTKAFDRLDHKLLLTMLSYYGFGIESVELLKSYLTKRKQIVKMNDCLSEPCNVTCGVPQGSILGPLLFIIYTSELLLCIEHCTSHLYVDDTQMYYSFNPDKIEEANYRINRDLNKLATISKGFGLELNADKCKLLLFGRKGAVKKCIESGKLNIEIDGSRMDFVISAKNLGVELDQSLRFTKHVSQLIRKSFLKLKLIYSMRLLLNQETKKQLCESLILSNFNYADVVYHKCLTRYDENRIQLIQNACVRLICGLRKFNRGVTEKLKQLGWIRMSERRQLHSLTLYHKIMHIKSPAYLYNKVTFGHDVHQLSTRTRNKIIAPKQYTVFFERSFTYCIYKYYNLYIDIAQNMSVKAFSKYIRNQFLQ